MNLKLNTKQKTNIMKNLVLITLILLLITSCTSYREFVSVQTRNNIPDGTQSIILTDENIETVKEAFKSKGIMIKSLEGGFETEEILLDEGTRAMYKGNRSANPVLFFRPGSSL